MPIRFKVTDGALDSVEADSVTEALEFLRSYQASNGTRKAERRKKAAKRAQVGAEATALPERLSSLVVLLDTPDGPLETSQVAHALNIKPRELGPLVSTLRRWAKADGFNDGKVTVTERGSTGKPGTITLTGKFRKWWNAERRR